MKDSSDPVESRITRTPSSGRSRRSWASATSTATELRLSLAPGTTRREPMSAIAAVAPSAKKSPARRSPARRSSAPSAISSRPEEDAVHDRDALAGALVLLRREPHADPGQLGVEHEPAVRGVVVGDEHDRALRLAVAGLGDHVPGGAVGQRAAPEPEPAAAHVVPHGRRGRAAHQHRQHPPPEERQERRDGVQDAERPPVAAVGRLLLDARLAAGGAQLLGEPLRRLCARPRTPTGGRCPPAGARLALAGPVASARVRLVLARPGLADPDPLQRRGMGAEEQRAAAAGGRGRRCSRTAMSPLQRDVGGGVAREVERELVRARLHRPRELVAGDPDREGHERHRQGERGQRGRSGAPVRVVEALAPAEALGQPLGQQACPRAPRGRARRARAAGRRWCWWPSSWATTWSTWSRGSALDQVVVEHHPLASARARSRRRSRRWSGGWRPRGRPGPRPRRPCAPARAPAIAAAPAGSGSNLLKSGSITTGKSQTVTTPMRHHGHRARHPPAAAEAAHERQRRAPRPPPQRRPRGPPTWPRRRATAPSPGWRGPRRGRARARPPRAAAPPRRASARSRPPPRRRPAAAASASGSIRRRGGRRAISASVPARQRQPTQADQALGTAEVLRPLHLGRAEVLFHVHRGGLDEATRPEHERGRPGGDHREQDRRRQPRTPSLHCPGHCRRHHIAHRPALRRARQSARLRGGARRRRLGRRGRDLVSGRSGGLRRRARRMRGPGARAMRCLPGRQPRPRRDRSHRHSRLLRERGRGGALDARPHLRGVARVPQGTGARPTPRREIGLYHASPRDPVWEYVLSTWQAGECMNAMEPRVGAVGPLPRGALLLPPARTGRWTARRRRTAPSSTSPRASGCSIPGGVGQPRDGDRRAAWLLRGHRGLDRRLAAGGVSDRRGRPGDRGRRAPDRCWPTASTRPVRARATAAACLALVALAAGCGADDGGRADPAALRHGAREPAGPHRAGDLARGASRRCQEALGHRPARSSGSWTALPGGRGRGGARRPATELRPALRAGGPGVQRARPDGDRDHPHRDGDHSDRDRDHADRDRAHRRPRPPRSRPRPSHRRPRCRDGSGRRRRRGARGRRMTVPSRGGGPLPDRAQARRGRDVHRLPGHRHRARAGGGGEAPGRAPGRRRGLRGPLPARGAGGGAAPAPERRAGVRLGPGSREPAPLHRHGVRGRALVRRPPARAQACSTSTTPSRSCATPATGLDYAHRAGVVHRDVKPGNLLIAEEVHTTKIADFGIAKAAELTRITQVGSVLGTAAYLSPEQAHGEEAGPASDIYSLGVCAYQFLTGRLAARVHVAHRAGAEAAAGRDHADHRAARRRCRPSWTRRCGCAWSARPSGATPPPSSSRRRSRPGAAGESTDVTRQLALADTGRHPRHAGRGHGGHPGPALTPRADASPGAADARAPVTPPGAPLARRRARRRQAARRRQLGHLPRAAGDPRGDRPWWAWCS